MNLDVPYNRLNEKSRVEYIPLKLALKDVDDNGNPKTSFSLDNNTTSVSVNDFTVEDAVNYRGNSNSGEKQFWNMVIIGILSAFVLFAILYAIYYFVILRERRDLFVDQPHFY